MAITPPSDILLDAARAADPAKVRAATARLARLAADPAAGNEGFAKALASAQAANSQAANSQAGVAGEPGDASSARSTLLAAAPSGAGGQRDTVQAMSSEAVSSGRKSQTYQKFEAVLLQQFVESMLPKDDELFGDKTSAGVYRSMMAEQFATQLAKSGGIGIAKAVAAAHPAPGVHPPPATDTTT